MQNRNHTENPLKKLIQMVNQNSSVPQEKGKWEPKMMETGSIVFEYNMMSMRLKSVADPTERRKEIEKFIKKCESDDQLNKLLVPDFEPNSGKD